MKKMNVFSSSLFDTISRKSYLFTKITSKNLILFRIKTKILYVLGSLNLNNIKNLPKTKYNGFFIQCRPFFIKNFSLFIVRVNSICVIVKLTKN